MFLLIIVDYIKDNTISPILYISLSLFLITNLQRYRDDMYN